jgi:MSHA pilin protein MshC
MAGQRGFTLVELVMVIVIAGVLAIFAAPRVLSSNDFHARGFSDETQALLRFAQKTAVAQRRTVCVAFAAGSVTLSIASAAATFTCDSSLAGPRGESPARASARSGVTYSALPTDFNFDGLGQPLTSTGLAQATQTIRVSNASSVITVETVTGYVHE